MALHTDLPIYRSGVRLLALAIQIQQQMPRGVKRIKNEAEWIRHSGGVLVRVHRSGLQPVASHVSETELAGIQADHELLNDGSLSTLFDQVDRLLDTLRPSGAPSHL